MQFFGTRIYGVTPSQYPIKVMSDIENWGAAASQSHCAQPFSPD
jgi:hypothetical protein